MFLEEASEVHEQFFRGLFAHSFDAGEDRQVVIEDRFGQHAARHRTQFDCELRPDARQVQELHEEFALASVGEPEQVQTVFADVRVGGDGFLGPFGKRIPERIGDREQILHAADLHRDLGDGELSDDAGQCVDHGPMIAKDPRPPTAETGDSMDLGSVWFQRAFVAEGVPFSADFCYNRLMPAGKYTHRFSVSLAAALGVLVPLTAITAPDDTDLAEVKSEFNELWHAAAETGKRRAALEQSLAQFDTKVADARRDLARAADQRKAIREQIAEHRVLVDALKGQIAAAQQTQDFYAGIANSRKEDFAAFVRFLVSRDIADRESGPSAGGDLMKRMLRRSLGDSIEDALARDAALKARQRFFGQIDVLLTEAERVKTGLHASADELARELDFLESQYGTVSSIVTEKSKFIDDSWKIKKLTEEELQYVAREAAESQSRIAGMQASITKINDELKSGKVQGLEAELGKLRQTEADLVSQRDALKLKDQAMQLIEDAAIKAYQQAMQAKNTDKKLYRRIEEKQLQRSNDAEQLTSLVAKFQLSGSTVTQRDIDLLEAKIAFADKALALMKDGVPQDLAEAYLDADRRATDAKAERAVLARKITDLSAEVAAATAASAEKAAAIAEIEKQYVLSDLPPVFIWPVNGPVTAGYFDPDYETVFHVPHRGMDIAVPQASPVRSVSDGVVYAVKDGGARGYSYVIVAHRNGYASLYGHVSSVFVKNGDIVAMGQVIALSGGTPGTYGAGYMTTGAHVHLEMMKNGAHVNPMSVLPPR